MVELKVRKFGTSLGVVLPKAVISRLRTQDGEPLFLIEAPDGGYQLTPYDPAFEKKMAKAEDIIGRYRNMLHGQLTTLHGGAPGLRDDALLQSAVSRPQHQHAYADDPEIIDMATAYTVGMVRNHAFVDGNKRTGFVVGVLFLELNGYLFTAKEWDATQAVLQLAAGTLDEAGYMAFLHANTQAV